MPRLLAQLQAIGVSISKRRLGRLLIGGQDEFLAEARDVLRAGLETASWITVDDTGARHKGANGVCTQIGNDNFAWFGPDQKQEPAELPRSAACRTYRLRDQRGGAELHAPTCARPGPSSPAWRNTRTSNLPTRRAGRRISSGLASPCCGSPQTRSRLRLRARCGAASTPTSSCVRGWLSATTPASSPSVDMRSAGCMPSGWCTSSNTFTEPQRAAQQHVRSLIWRFYADLKAYRVNPTAHRRGRTARPLRSHLLPSHRLRHPRSPARTAACQQGRVVGRARSSRHPAHTNGSENDIRCQVTKRKVSGGTRSDVGRDCRDAFLGLAKTCAKLGVAFWDYLGSRIGIAGASVVPPLPDLIRCRGQPA